MPRARRTGLAENLNASAQAAGLDEAWTNLWQIEAGIAATLVAGIWTWFTGSPEGPPDDGVTALLPTSPSSGGGVQHAKVGNESSHVTG